MNELNQNLKKIKLSSTKKKFPSCASKNHSLGKRQRERDSFYYTIPRPLKEREREREINVSADLRRSFTEEL
jgi:hypothetical protein